MIPLLSTSSMRAADADAVAARGAEYLVRSAGTAVALEAANLLGSCYGARVCVIAGPGLNGADGRVAGAWLTSRGSHVDVVEVTSQPATLDHYDLVIDAAFGLGCSRPYVAPAVTKGTRVLAVDLPSGVDSDTGELLGSPLAADVTIAMGAFKYAHFTGPASKIMGKLRCAKLGIVRDFDDGVMDDGDLAGLVQHNPDDHKWSHAITIFAGSALMPGAAELVARGALAGGASMIRLASRDDARVDAPSVVVRTNDDTVDPRSRAVVAGPGLGVDATTWLRPRLAGVSVPVVLDADGLDQSLVLASRDSRRQWVLTPHEGEFLRLTGSATPSNRIASVRQLAQSLGCVILLKGPVTVIANPSGHLRIIRSGTSALATAGTGDVLAGLIGATIARGYDTFNASALAAHLHGVAGQLLAPYGTASQLVDRVTTVLSQVTRGQEYL